MSASGVGRHRDVDALTHPADVDGFAARLQASAVVTASSRRAYHGSAVRLRQLLSRSLVSLIVASWSTGVWCRAQSWTHVRGVRLVADLPRLG